MKRSSALLLAELVKIVKKALNIEFRGTFLWTDSQIVLDWLNANPKRYKIFIKTRLEKINILTEINCWHHVSSKNNAADCASRGMLPSELLNLHMWFNGPDFLYGEIITKKLIPRNEIQAISANFAAFC